MHDARHGNMDMSIRSPLLTSHYPSFTTYHRLILGGRVQPRSAYTHAPHRTRALITLRHYVCRIILHSPAAHFRPSSLILGRLSPHARSPAVRRQPPATARAPHPHPHPHLILTLALSAHHVPHDTTRTCYTHHAAIDPNPTLISPDRPPTCTGSTSTVVSQGHVQSVINRGYR